MTFDVIELGYVRHIPITHGYLFLEFEDYDNLFLKVRGKKPKYFEVYTSSSEPWHDYMLGFDFYWEDDTVERMSFQDFWDFFNKNWDWGYKSKHVGGYFRKNGEYVEPEDYLDLKYSEVSFQTHQAGACVYNRISGKVTGFHADVNAMKESVKRFAESF